MEKGQLPPDTLWLARWKRVSFYLSNTEGPWEHARWRGVSFYMTYSGGPQAQARSRGEIITHTLWLPGEEGSASTWRTLIGAGQVERGQHLPDTIWLADTLCLTIGVGQVERGLFLSDTFSTTRQRGVSIYLTQSGQVERGHLLPDALWLAIGAGQVERGQFLLVSCLQVQAGAIQQFLSRFDIAWW